jgi:hypothetical protein
MKLYFKSIQVNSQLIMPVLLWNVTCMFNLQISGEILRNGFEKVK